MRRQYLLAGSSLAALVAAYSAQAQQSTETYSYDALGRLISVETAGGQNNNETHSICYDDAGNRTQYKSDASGTPVTCAGGGTPPPPPPPPPPPSNNPPNTTNDSASGACSTTVSINLTANDTDPEGNYPLVLQSIVKTSGGASAIKISNSSVSATFGPAFDASSFTYTVADSLGATSTGQLNLFTSSCGGGGPPPL